VQPQVAWKQGIGGLDHISRICFAFRIPFGGIFEGCPSAADPEEKRKSEHHNERLNHCVQEGDTLIV
jgi:hypothetical protein